MIKKLLAFSLVFLLIYAGLPLSVNAQTPTFCWPACGAPGGAHPGGGPAAGPAGIGFPLLGGLVNLIRHNRTARPGVPGRAGWWHGLPIDANGGVTPYPGMDPQQSCRMHGLYLGPDRKCWPTPNGNPNVVPSVTPPPVPMIIGTPLIIGDPEPPASSGSGLPAGLPGGPLLSIFSPDRDRNFADDIADQVLNRNDTPGGSDLQLFMSGWGLSAGFGKILEMAGGPAMASNVTSFNARYNPAIRSSRLEDPYAAVMLRLVGPERYAQLLTGKTTPGSKGIPQVDTSLQRSDLDRIRGLFIQAEQDLAKIYFDNSLEYMSESAANEYKLAWMRLWAQMRQNHLAASKLLDEAIRKKGTGGPH